MGALARTEYQGVLYACGADVHTVLADNWHFHGAAVRQADDGTGCYLLATYRRTHSAPTLGASPQPKGPHQHGIRK